MRKEFTVSERVAIAQAVAAKLGPRHGSNQYEAKGGGNISTSSEEGKTRDIAAAKAGLGSGKTYEAAKKVVADGAPDLVKAMDEGAH
jgi:ParB family chromosome partitioning protein